MENVKAMHTPLAQKHGEQEAAGKAVDPSAYRSINPNSMHLQAIKRILRYVKGTIDHGLRIISQSSFRLYGFSDVDWAGCAITRMSTTGYSIYLGANCFSWSSRKQNILARSSTEAEYRALAATTVELTWISYILQDIGMYIKTSPALFCDNLSALYMT
ncbi:PREDICTED: uncharacterized protein LOC109238682 [Nicotiana attenuata]|uniref:uncharacterized protein LOC109238682 n=1 Tax=Nicotiana attenuata TaxID=49451 RepID=UPI00090570FE|nr:PREDICTED: uncharacterized protein LOC109238682 [Nicotiana attenuata]